MLTEVSWLTVIQILLLMTAIMICNILTTASNKNFGD
jgi:hypothetical protein